MNNERTFIFIITAYVLSLLFELVFGLSNYQLQQKSKYSLLNRYPFELAQGSKRYFLPIHYVLVSISSILMILFAYFFFKELSDAYLIVGTIMTILIAAGIFLMFVMTDKRPRFRMIVVLVSALATVALSAIIGTHFLSGYSPRGQRFTTFEAILGFVPAFAALIVIVNPNLYKYIISDKRIRQDGILEISRPKKYAPSYTEWLLIAINVYLFLLVNIVNFIH